MTARPSSTWPRSVVGRFLVLGLAYYVAARLSLRLALVDGVVTPIWPPTGIALVGLLTFGPRLWAAVTLPAFLVNLPITPSPFAAAAIAVGNTLAPLLAAWLLSRAGFRRELDRLRDALAVVLLGALVAMTVSATCGAGALWLFGAVPSDGLAATWSVWWAGDATGILVFAPIILSLRRPGWGSWRGAAEAGCLFVAIATVAFFVFRSPFQSAYLVFPFLIWAAVRFGQLGASVATLIVVGTAVSAAIAETGPFARTTLLERMLTLQIYNAGAALTSFVLAAVMTERSKARAALEQAAVALEERFDRERRIAETLQRSLLPAQLPEIPGVALAGRYLPGAAGLEVGGDWYDVFLLASGRVGLAIGDVVGRGLGAAAAMGQLRAALRAYSLETDSPAVVLERLSRLVQEFEAPQMATLVYAVLDPETGRLCFASAGHPPPLLVAPAGTAAYLEADRCPPLGVAPAAPEETVVVLEPGSTLLLYTDGLVEKRGGSIEDGMETLRQAAAEHSADLDSLCDDRILATLHDDDTADDVAVLALRLLPLAGDDLRLTFPAEASALSSLRRALRRWLAGLGATPDEIHDLTLACDEAATNVLEHAYGPGEGVLHVEAAKRGERVSVTVRDRGQWRSPRGEGRGRGFTLMHALVDAVEVIPGPSGTEVRLHRRLGGPAELPTTGASPIVAPFTATVRPRVNVVHFAGDIDVSNAPRLQAELLNAIGNQDLGLVVELTGARHLDSAGIRLLFQVAARLAQRRQRLGIAVPQDSPIRRVLALAQLDACVPITTTLDEGVERIRSEAAVGPTDLLSGLSEAPFDGVERPGVEAPGNLP